MRVTLPFGETADAFSVQVGFPDVYVADHVTLLPSIVGVPENGPPPDPAETAAFAARSSPASPAVKARRA